MSVNKEKVRTICLFHEPMWLNFSTFLLLLIIRFHHFLHLSTLLYAPFVLHEFWITRKEEMTTGVLKLVSEWKEMKVRKFAYHKSWGKKNMNKIWIHERENVHCLFNYEQCYVYAISYVTFLAPSCSLCFFPLQFLTIKSKRFKVTFYVSFKNQRLKGPWLFCLRNIFNIADIFISNVTSV